MRRSMVSMGLVASVVLCSNCALASITLTNELGGVALELIAFNDSSSGFDVDRVSRSIPVASASVPGAEITGNGAYQYGGLTYSGVVANITANAYLDVSASITQENAHAYAWEIPPNIWQVVTFETTDHYEYEFTKVISATGQAYAGRVYFNVGGYYGTDGITAASGILSPGVYTVGFETDFRLDASGVGSYSARSDLGFDLTLSPTSSIPDPGTHGDPDMHAVPEIESAFAWGIGLLTVAVGLVLMNWHVRWRHCSSNI